MPLVYVRCATLYVAKIDVCYVRVWDKKINMLINFLEAVRISDVSVTYTFRISSMRVPGALHMLVRCTFNARRCTLHARSDLMRCCFIAWPKRV